MSKIHFNKGDAYEAKIFGILKKLGWISKDAKRAGAGTGTDIVFLHKGTPFNLEVKKDLYADYGQKMLKWSKENGWQWACDDDVTQLYTKIGALEYLNKKGIIPRKFTKDRKNIKLSDKKEDQKIFEDKVTIHSNAFFEYYKLKKCFYIQIGKGFGFYHMTKDIANLGTQPFNAVFVLRFRAKTIHSKPVSNYAFYGVLKIRGQSNVIKSKFNIEQNAGQTLPPFIS